MTREIIASTIPVLNDETSDYTKKGNDCPEYSAKVKTFPSEVQNQKAEIRHNLTGNSIIAEFIESGKAKFGCELIFKGSFRREFHLHETSDISLKSNQSFSWDNSNVSGGILFRPVIVATKKIEDIILSKDHKVDDFWLDTEISIPKFSVLADAGIRGSDITTRSLLKIFYDKKLAEFEMDVVRSGGHNNTFFRVNVGKSLHQLIKDKSQDNFDLRKAILINALTGAFSILLRDYQINSEQGETEIAQCDVLSGLHSKLKDLNVETWDSEDFSPVKAATCFEQFTWRNQPDEVQDDD